MAEMLSSFGIDVAVYFNFLLNLLNGVGYDHFSNYRFFPISLKMAKLKSLWQRIHYHA